MKAKIYRFSAVFAILVVFAFVAGFVFFLSSPADASANKNSFPINEYGQTYGSAANISSRESLPDLVSAVASNGKEGYILKTDIILIDELSQAKNPEDAVAKMNNYFFMWAEAFTDYTYLKTGATIDLKATEETLRQISLSNGIKCSFEFLNETDKAAVLNLLPKDYRTNELAQEALEAAYKSNEICIPVYLVDGKTIIGEMIIK